MAMRSMALKAFPGEGREDGGIFFCKEASAYILLLNVLFTYDIHIDLFLHSA